MKKFITLILAAALCSALISGQAMAQKAKPADADNFYKSENVTVEKVSFPNQYKMKIVANFILPKGLDITKKHPAIVIGHPIGAVKEQASTLYATKMAERGFVTLAVDLPFWGESDGEPRNAVAPDMYSETFSAAVDYLSKQGYVDRERIGGIGICASGGFVISAAKIDPRLKAVATVSMYDMGQAVRNGLNKSQSVEQRKEFIAEAAQQRWVEVDGGQTRYTGGTVLEINENSHPVEVEFYEFYRMPRGAFAPAGMDPKLTTTPTLSSYTKLMNFYPFNDIETIAPRPLLFITGDQAHSKEFSEDAYQRAAEPKELFYVKGAGHVDLYDRVNMIPFDKLNDFFTRNLK